MSKAIKSIGVVFASFLYLFLSLFLGFLLGQEPPAVYTIVMVLYFLLGGGVIMVCSSINFFSRRRVFGGAKLALILVLFIACARLAFPDTVYRIANYLWHVPLPRALAIIRLPLFVLVTGGHPSPDHEAEWLGHEIGAALLPLLLFLIWFLLSLRQSKRANVQVATRPQM